MLCQKPLRCLYGICVFQLSSWSENLSSGASIVSPCKIFSVFYPVCHCRGETGCFKCYCSLFSCCHLSHKRSHLFWTRTNSWFCWDITYKWLKLSSGSYRWANMFIWCVLLIDCMLTSISGTTLVHLDWSIVYVSSQLNEAVRSWPEQAFSYDLCCISSTTF